ncbi:MAG: thiol peroxidase [Propionicimonas sp.]|nr:thiol peroxidase [Propionicimonas sp.]
MAETIARGITVHTAGELPTVGSTLPPFELTVAGLEELDSATLAGSRIVLNIFPSVDTATCAMSVRRFNELAASLVDTTVVCVSMDLPYALQRFCGAEGIEDVVTASAFRSSFGVDYGVQMVDGPMRGLLARSVVVADTDGTVLHTELVVPTGGKEPDYDAALAVLG